MANFDTVNSVISPGLKKEVVEMVSLLEQLDSLVIKINQDGRAAEKGASQAQNVRQLTTASAELEKVQSMINAAHVESARTLAAAKVQYAELTRQLRETAKSENSLYKARQAQSAAAKQAAADEKELNRLIKEEERSNLAQKRRQESAARRDQVAAEREYVKLWEQGLKARDKADAAARQAAVDTVAIDSNVALSKTLNDLRWGYDRLTEAERKNEHIGGVLQARIQELDAQLKKTDASTGRFGRNVGDYEKATTRLGTSFAQLTGELPSLSNGMRTFFSAIGNNIVPAFEAIKELIAAQRQQRQESIANAIAQGEQAAATALAGGASEEAASEIGNLAKEQALAAAEGQKGASAFKAIASSLFSFQTILAVGVTLLTVYGPQIAEFFGDNSEEAKKAEKANKDYKDSLDQIETSARNNAQQDIARMNVLTSLAADNAQSTKNRERAIKELQETYPDYFGNLDKEIILQGKATTAINEATEALLARASAQAAEKKFAASSENVYDLEQKLKEAEKRVEEAQAYFDRNINNPIGFTRMSSKRELKNALEDLTQISDALGKAREEQRGYLDDARKYAQQAGQTLFGNDPKGTRTPKPLDTTNETINVEERINKALADLKIQRIQQDSEAQQAIFDNEQEALVDRLAANQQYYSNLLEQQQISQGLELANVEANLRKIAEIERSGPKSNEQKALLLQKSAFEAEKTAITEKYASEGAKAEREINARAQDAIEKDLKRYVDRRKELYANEIANVSLNLSREEQEVRVRLSERYARGLISETQYRDELRSLNDRYDLQELEQTRDKLMLQIQDLQQHGQETLDLEKKLADVTKGIETEKADHAISQNERVADRRKKLAQLERDLAKEVLSAALAMGAQGTEREISEITKKQNAVDRKYSDERTKIENSLLTAEDREQRLLALEASTQAEKNRLAQEQEKVEKEQADRRKKLAGYTILLNTAQAVSEQLKQPGGFAANAAQIEAIIAIGTAQAIIAATAKYAVGTDNHPGGPAIMGEKGVELVREPSGKAWFTAGTATYYPDLVKGAQVIPHDEVLRMANIAAMSGMPNLHVIAQDNEKWDQLIDATREQTSALERAMRENRTVLPRQQHLYPNSYLKDIYY